MLGALAGGLVCCAGCSEKEEVATPVVQPTQSHQVSREKTVSVPPAVVGAWKAVKISVIDKKRAKEGTYTVPVGGSLRVPGSPLKIEVEAFLPAFVMEGTVITSESNELKNPGAKVLITDNGVVVFKGWLFSKFPNTHAFMHPTYGFTLAGIVPADR